MPLTSLLYISQSTIDPRHASDVVEQIVARSILVNRARGLTGALLFTGTHFAQVIEGSMAVVDALLLGIERDPRHHQIRTVERAPLASRRFATWDMAYAGPSQFVARHVTRLLGDPSPSEQSRAAAWLTELMAEFARD